MRRKRRAASFRLRRICLAMMLPLGFAAHAQIRTDSSLGFAAQTLLASRFTPGQFAVIPQSIGKQVGGNLFHSFSTFNIGTSQAAYFTTNTPGLANVISRVTGGSASQIYGQLALFSSAAAPNFFFINPAGVTFGPGASIYVPGAFHVSTANYVKFADGNFHADLGRTSTFSSAAPEAFGFLGTTRAAINVFGSASLSATGTQSISLVAGDISIGNGFNYGGAITTEAGDIRIAAVGQQAQEVPFTGLLGQAVGNLNIYYGGSVTSGTFGFDNSGSISLGAGTITLYGGASIFSYSAGFGSAGDLSLSATQGISVLEGSQVVSRAYYVGNAGTIKLRATDITIGGDFGSAVAVATDAQPGSYGNAGNIDIVATGNLSVLGGVGGSRVSSTTFSYGNAGLVKASAANILIDGEYSSFAGILSESPLSSGNAGSIELTTPGSLTVRNNGYVSTSTVAGADAGAITVHAGTVLIGDAPYAPAGIVSSAIGGNGRSGNIDITVTGNLSALNSAIISSTSGGAGGAGSVTIHAGSVLVDGGAIAFPVISSDTSGAGNAGAVQVIASGDVSVVNGGNISSSTYGSGDAGLVKVTAANVIVDGQNLHFAGIVSDTYGGTGKAGNVEVTAAGAVLVLYGGHISSSTFNGGNAGAVKVQAASVLVGGQGAGILSEAVFGAGDGGRVEVEATGQVHLASGGEISARTRSAGNAGAVKVSAGSLFIDGQGVPTGIFNTAEQTSTGGNAGNIDIVVTGSVAVVNDGQISSSTYAAGNAGTVDIAAGGNMYIYDGGLVTSTTDSTGNAGSIKVRAASLAILAPAPGYLTGISTDTRHDTGTGGSVDVAVTGDLLLRDGGSISSGTSSAGNAGAVSVRAASINLDGGGARTAISSTTVGSTGNAGRVDVVATGELRISMGGLVSSGTNSHGNAGSVNVQAGSIWIDSGGGLDFTGITTQAGPGSTGNAGQVDIVSAGGITLLRGATIDSNTFTSGNAGSVRVRAQEILIDSTGSYTFPGGAGRAVGGILSSVNYGASGNAGTVDVEATGQVSVVGGGAISSGTQAAGHAGSVRVAAGRVLVDGADSSINAEAIKNSSGQTGSVTVSATERITLSSGGSLSIRNDATVADPGSIVPTTLSVSAPTITLNGGSITAASAGNVAASNIVIGASGELSILKGGFVTSGTFGAGNAGSVRVVAGAIVIDAQDSDLFTGITTQAQAGSTGNAGRIDVIASGDVTIHARGAQIASSTFSSGNAGSVNVQADGKLSILAGGQIASDTIDSGNAGAITVAAGSIDLDGQTLPFAGIFSDTIGSGHAGLVTVQSAGKLSIVSGGSISSSAHIAGDAAPVHVSAGSITIDGQGKVNSGIFSQSRGPGGNASDVVVDSAGALSLVNGGQISSSAIFTGNAGTVTVSAASIDFDGKRGTGVASSIPAGIFSETFGDGNAGQVSVLAAGGLSIANGGRISSSTFLSGAAGSVLVRAGELRVDGADSSIAASASSGSSGQTGNVTVATSESITLSNGGSLSIKNDATVANPGAIVPTTLSVSAPDITLHNASITAASSGNVAASDIQISFTNQLFVDPSSITTSSNLGNGGSIVIQGGQVITLENSQITTSVLGLTGNGGNITISADTLLLFTGFIQANTGAANAAGGLVTINVQTLLASGNSLFTGGDVPYVFQPGVFGFNVIQAAAPSGLSGVVQLATPPLDVSGSLTGLTTQALDLGGLARNPCQVTGGSSLAQAGRGGLPPSARGLLRPEPDATEIAQQQPVLSLARAGVVANGCM